MEFLLTYQEISTEIEKIEDIYLNKRRACREIINYCSKILEIYREKVRDFIFPDVPQEIQFFKRDKSIPLTFKIFYHRLLDIDLLMPYDATSRQAFLGKKQDEIYQFISLHKNFAEYIALEEEYLDEHYFTRRYFLKSPVTHCYFHERDPNFSTSHDLLFCQLQANKKVLEHLNKNLDSSLDQENSIAIPWTQSKVSLIELIYALHASGAINNGNSSIKEIIKVFEKLTGKDLSDYSHTFLRMRGRDEPLKFINKMSQSLSEYIQNFYV